MDVFSLSSASLTDQRDVSLDVRQMFAVGIRLELPCRRNPWRILLEKAKSLVCVPIIPCIKPLSRRAGVIADRITVAIMARIFLLISTGMNKRVQIAFLAF